MPIFEPPSVELRRAYHDRIAALKARSQEVVDSAVKGSRSATLALLGQDRSLAGELDSAADRTSSVVSGVDAEVVDLLATQAPVARDLRLILAARDVAHIALLCVGLDRAVASRSGSGGRILDPDLSERLGGVGRATSDLLAGAAASWAGLDPAESERVVAGAEGVRLLHLELLSSLVRLDRVPMEAALDLSMAARAFERLTDHAVEIAGRVQFVAG